MTEGAFSMSSAVDDGIGQTTRLPGPEVLDAVLELEQELQRPECRADEGRLRELLAPDFVEIGASGRRWDLDTILALLREERPERDGVITMTGLAARPLAPGVVQVFYESHRDGRRARRTSIWRQQAQQEQTWQQVFHQGTPVT